MPTGHVQGVDDELGAQVVSDRPAHAPSGVDIDHRGAVHPALAGAVLINVGDPQPVRGIGAEPALDVVLYHRLGALDAAPTPAVHTPASRGPA